ncbi:uncharacterized protein LOC133551239 [Nerophis ophidion]|uniref:uncharacterized protein LOC133551239 n=1 Tax=Nerophis ophidion TaxID=159077 RepID=UPI002AE0137C|nr:uncharacterized protein LOC133551239 [Nerophis ophidion]
MKFHDRFTREGTIGPSPYSGNTAIPSPYGLHINCQFPYGGHISSLSPYGLNVKGPFPYKDHAYCPSTNGLTTKGPSLYGGCTPHPYPHDFNTAGPSPNVYNTSGPSPGVHNGLPASRVNPPDHENAAFLAPDRRDAGNPSREDTICYRPQAEKSWTPCDGCREEFEKILREKQRIEEVLLKIDPGQVRVLQTLCDLVGDKYSDRAPQQSGQQELFPESGVYISSFRLAAMSHASKPKCMRLFHVLFDHFFTVEECQNSVPFGRPGKKPSGTGKRILDQKKVEGILSKFTQTEGVFSSKLGNNN